MLTWLLHGRYTDTVYHTVKLYLNLFGSDTTPTHTLHRPSFQNTAQASLDLSTKVHLASGDIVGGSETRYSWACNPACTWGNVQKAS